MGKRKDFIVILLLAFIGDMTRSLGLTMVSGIVYIIVSFAAIAFVLVYIFKYQKVVSNLTNINYSNSRIDTLEYQVEQLKKKKSRKSKK